MPGDPELTQAVQVFLSQMWQHIDNTIRAMIGHHHREHEPGGNDQVRLPVYALSDVHWLKDVSGDPPDDGDTLIYYRHKTNGVASYERDGWWEIEPAGRHQAHLGVILPASVIPPGPTNITGKSFSVRGVLISSDGACTGTLSFGGSYSFSFGAAGGSQSWDLENNPGTWGGGSSISVTYPNDTTASWLTADIWLAG